MTVKVITGDALEVLRGMNDESVHTCVTSPPYYSLRDYGTVGQVGLEDTPAAFVARLVGIFAEVKRVLCDNGTLWANLGDSYAGSNMTGGTNSKETGRREERMMPSRNTGAVPAGLKSKDLIGIPWMVAFALRADGWYLRSDIIWSKPNPMPESVTDRPTKAHEYIFLLSKSPTYYYDADAIAEPVSQAMLDQIEQGYNGSATKDYIGNGVQDPSAVKARILAGRTRLRSSNFKKQGDVGNHLSGAEYIICDGKRNKRSVWTVTTKPYSGAHFATFPPDLIEPCILAGCPEQCCSVCGAPWKREIERESIALRPNSNSIRGDSLSSNASGTPQRGSMSCNSRTLGFYPSCLCDAPTVPGTVLDPFFGAGTTGLVADRLQRNCIGIELNPEYADLARKRIAGDCPMFAEVA